MVSSSITINGINNPWQNIVADGESYFLQNTSDHNLLLKFSSTIPSTITDVNYRDGCVVLRPSDVINNSMASGKVYAISASVESISVTLVK